MRVPGLLAAVVVAGSAAAEPPAKQQLSLPDVVEEARSKALPRRADRPSALGVDGKPSSGSVIVPPPHADAEPYPRGALIAPPDPNDPMALAPGTNQLLPREPRTRWLPRDLSRLVKRGADLVWDLLIPEA